MLVLYITDSDLFLYSVLGVNNDDHVGDWEHVMVRWQFRFRFFSIRPNQSSDSLCKRGTLRHLLLRAQRRLCLLLGCCHLRR